MNYNNFSHINTLVIGDIMLDNYIYGNCNRISPEAPVQIVNVNGEKNTLGGAGNVLKNIKALNSKADIITVTGDDDNSKIIIEQLIQAGITGNFIIKDKKRCTTVKSRVLVSNHQLIRLDREDVDPIDKDIESQLFEILKKHIKKYDIILISDYSKGLLTDSLLNNIFTLCRSEGIKTIVDPKGVDFLKYKGANIIKPNKKEAAIASGIQINDNDSLRASCIKIKEITGCDDVIITLSEEGISFFTDSKLTVIPTKAMDIIDVTGAGDTVLASLGIAIAAGNTLYDACDLANHAAAIVVSKVGSSTATLNEIAQKFGPESV